MHSTNRTNPIQPIQWSPGMVMSVCNAQIRYSLECGTGKLKLGFADMILTKEAGR